MGSLIGKQKRKQADNRPNGIRIFIVGVPGSGKQALLRRWTLRTFSDDQQPDVLEALKDAVLPDGRTAQIKVVTLPRARALWTNDAGHSDFLDTCIALILFDESEPQDDVVDWIVQLEKKKELFRQQNGVIAVVANKSDLQVDKEPLWRPWMEELEARNIRLFRVSCRTGNGVDEMFNNVISQYCALRIELGARQDYEEATNASPRSS